MTRVLLSLFLFLALVSCHGSPTDPSGGSVRATLTGTMTYTTGYTAAGVRIGLIAPNGDIVGSGETDNYGHYSIARVPPGHYTLVFTSSAYIEKLRTEVDLHSGVNTFDAVLP
jgi:hypothetical protein